MSKAISIEIIEKYRERGLTLQDLADASGVSRQRIEQLWTRSHPEEHYAERKRQLKKEGLEKQKDRPKAYFYCNHCGTRRERGVANDRKRFCDQDCAKAHRNRRLALKLTCGYCQIKFHPHDNYKSKSIQARRKGLAAKANKYFCCIEHGTKYGGALKSLAKDIKAYQNGRQTKK